MWKNAKIIGANQKRGEAGQERGHKDFIMSRSQLVAFVECPAKWIAGVEVEEETKAMKFGSVLDCLATTPDELLAKFAIHPENYPVQDKKGVPTGEEKPWNLNSSWCKKWKAEADSNGLTVVSPDMVSEANSAHAALHSNAAVTSLIECSQKQVLIVAEWHDADTGLIVPMSALLDLVPSSSDPVWGKSLADIKTARNGNPATWDRVCDDSGYDVQAALYFDLYRAARPDEDRTDFVHIVIENIFPFHVVSPPPCFSTEFLAWGRSKYKAALKLYCQCLATGVWPSYPVVGIAFGNTQIISPDQLWAYRQCAGMTEFNMPPPARQKTVAEVLAEENFDTTP